MANVKRTQRSADVFREFAWNIVGVLATGKSVAQPKSSGPRKPKPPQRRQSKGGRK